jgi:L-amino acid N-acyltransferase YncA
VAVAPAFEDHGVGTALFETLFAEARRLNPPITRIELFARSGNAAAIELYKRLGFCGRGPLPRASHAGRRNDRRRHSDGKSCSEGSHQLHDLERRVRLRGRRPARDHRIEACSSTGARVNAGK